ncbi:aspartate dehydrogenase [Methanogenium sp. MK-MG]|uniref:aspartate dehydrogenase n=1 Tax=Methanogenium sp. MK-MG TaxID=2599926 RepID=UPI0013EB7BA1|nr:aspartate dehydrogenase [Methanogenium sp. MK-MG]KAF1075396.1 putative L-aspartate dehydrogenase [Methanogenium sp. MK-MG]
MRRIGLLGCGNVGEIIARKQEGFIIVALYDTAYARAQAVEEMCGAQAYESFDEFLAQDLDIVVEAASVSAVQTHAEAILLAGKDMVILSVGALTDEPFRDHLKACAEKNGKRIYIPSGAITGLDNLKVCQIAEVSKVMLRTTKNPRSLGIEADKPMLLFKGTARDCIRRYPKNINVAVAIELASGHEVEVELWADPGTDRNTHELIVEGEFGDITIRVSNRPSPENPATSYLAALSILTLLRNLDNPIQIGT